MITHLGKKKIEVTDDMLIAFSDSLQVVSSFKEGEFYEFHKRRLNHLTDLFTEYLKQEFGEGGGKL